MEYLFKSEYLGNGIVSNTIRLQHLPVVNHMFKRNYKDGEPASMIINKEDDIEQEDIRIKYFDNLMVSYDVIRDGDHILLQINRENTGRDDIVINLLVENGIILETIDLNIETTKKTKIPLIEDVLNKLIDELHVTDKQWYTEDTEFVNVYLKKYEKYSETNSIIRTGYLVNINYKQKAGNEEDIYIKDGKILIYSAS